MISLCTRFIMWFIFKQNKGKQRHFFILLFLYMMSVSLTPSDVHKWKMASYAVEESFCALQLCFWKATPNQKRLLNKIKKENWHKLASRSVWSSLHPSCNQPERCLSLTVSLINFNFEDHHHEMLPIKASAPPSLWRWRHRVKQKNSFALLNFSVGPALVVYATNQAQTHTAKVWSLSNDLSLQTSRSESTTVCRIISRSLVWRAWRYSCY